MKVLVADDDQISRKVVKAQLLKWGYEVVEAEDGEKAWQILNEEESLRMVIVDWMMPGIDGLELCHKLRESGDKSYHYIILLTSRDSKDDIIGGLNAGADDYITKPYMAQELEVRLRAGARILNLQQSLEKALEAQSYQAQHDSLTGLLNHRQILQVLENEIIRSARQGSSMAVIMGDLDHFKKVNDTYGHVAGDAVLIETAERLRNNIRLYDKVGRYGGEEFLLVLPGCTMDEALMIGKRILESIANQPIKFQDYSIPITISLGLAFNDIGAATDLADIVQAADAAMYQAKQNGRNRLELAAN
ncbi:MAG: diguanylate cyclase [Syntrophomonadaceae bacterium]|nr:diguanylate cyclase [Syntrophomonadaceae bacterium]